VSGVSDFTWLATSRSAEVRGIPLDARKLLHCPARPGRQQLLHSVEVFTEMLADDIEFLLGFGDCGLGLDVDRPKFSDGIG
jgi:hypothetical protein